MTNQDLIDNITNLLVLARENESLLASDLASLISYEKSEAVSALVEKYQDLTPPLYAKLLDYFRAHPVTIGHTYMARTFNQNFVYTLDPAEAPQLEDCLKLLQKKGIFDIEWNLTTHGHDVLYAATNTDEQE